MYRASRCGSDAEVGPPPKVVEEGLQRLVQDLVGGLGRMNVTSARPNARPGIQLFDVQALQGVLDIVGDSQPVGVGHDFDGVGFGRLTQVRPGSKQLVEHGGLLGGGQGVQRRVLIVHVRSLSSGDGTGGACVLP